MELDNKEMDLFFKATDVDSLKAFDQMRHYSRRVFKEKEKFLSRLKEIIDKNN